MNNSTYTHYYATQRTLIKRESSQLEGPQALSTQENRRTQH